MTRRSLFFTGLTAGALALLLGTGIATSQPRTGSPTWITAWGTSQQTLGTTSITNATVRMFARVTISGEAVRVRLDNAYGTSPLAIGNAYVGQRTRGAALAAGSNRQLMFKGTTTVTIPAGGTVVSDPVPMRVHARQDLTVSLYIPEADVRPSQHTGAIVTSYLTANGSGDVAADEAPTSFKNTATSMFWLKAIDLQSSSSKGSVIAYGDSITDGSCSTIDGHDRWEDWLAVRLELDAERRGNRGSHKAVVNEGIGGNTVTREGLQPPIDSTPGIERLERDVLSHHGVTHVILFMGTNDIRRGASAAQVIAGSQDILKRVKARGLKSIGATIIARHNAPASGTNTGWNPAKTAIRNEVNQWMRTQAPFDGLLDFDKAMRDPADPDMMYAPFNCDNIHPSSLGYYEMGKSISLDLFKDGLTRGATR